MTKQPSGFTVIPWQRHELIGMAWLVGSFSIGFAFTAGYWLGVA